jgi:serine/threonine protein kinase
MPLQAGQILNNRYRIVRLLGQGGFGAVYRAWDMNLNIVCALKENLDTSPEAQRQFAREASLLATLRHPHLPVVGDHFSLPGQGQYLVMDYVEGEDLQAMLDRTSGPLPEAQVLPWIIQMCDALTYLHSHHPPVIHRDIKPANIKITPEGQAMLVDFGVAKVYDPNLKTTLGARAVTPGYSPPEQYGRGATDARSDIYALGATLYALLTGDTPPDSVDIMTRRAAPPAPAHTLNLQISPQVSAGIEKAMQSDWSQRYTSAAEFAAAVAPPKPPEQVTPTPGQPVLATQASSQMPKASAAIRPQASPAAPRTQAVAPPSAVQAPSQPRKQVSGPSLPINRNWLVWGGVAAGLLVVIVIAIGFINNRTPKPSNIALAPLTSMPASTDVFFTSNRNGGWEVYRLSNEQGTQQVTSTAGGGLSWNGIPTPDGDVLFTSNRTGHREVYRLTLAGVERVTDTATGESWDGVPAPGGDVLFTSNRTGKKEIYRLSQDGVEQVTNTADGESWGAFPTPEGDILFTSTRDGHREIYRLTQDGLVRVTDTNPGESWDGMPTPEGDILFTSNRSGRPEIYRLGLNGVERVTNTGNGTGSWASIPAMNGDLLFTSDRDGRLEVYRLDQDGVVRVTNAGGGAGDWTFIPESQPPNLPLP